MIAWAAGVAEARGAIAHSIDASIQRHSQRDGPGPVKVTGISKPPKKPREWKEKIYVNFNRMGAIFATGGGKGNLAIWSSKETETALTKEAAAFIAAELFGKDIAFGDLVALVDAYKTSAYKTSADKNAVRPRFRERGYFDLTPRMGDEGGDRVRYTHLRHRKKEDHMIDRPCILYIDHREDAQMIAALEGIPNLSVIVAQLETGDFHARWGEAPDEQLVIERKTADDFEKSIGDRRIVDQVTRMCAKIDEGTPCYLLQQGNPFARSKPVDSIYAKNAVVTNSKKSNTYVGLAVRGIRTVHVETWEMAAKAIHDLILYSMKPSLLGGRPTPATLEDPPAECDTAK